MGGVDLTHAVDGTRVQTLSLVGRVLDLQARLDVLDGRGNEGHGRACHDASDAVAEGREVGDGVQRRVRLVCATTGRGRGVRLRYEYVFGEQPPVDGQAAQHQRVHEHPADQRRRRALVEAPDALVPHRLHDALQRPAEARRIRRL